MDENPQDPINSAPDRLLLLDAPICAGLYNLTGWTGTFFNYWKSQVGTNGRWVLSWYGNVETREYKDRIPAYDAVYLLEKLPKSIDDEGNEYFLTIGADLENGWQIDYRDVDDGQYHATNADTIVEATALMLEYLVDKGIILAGKA